MKKIILSSVFILSVISVLSAGNPAASRQETGEIVLRSLSVADGKILFRTDTGGCTDKKSFRVNVRLDRDLSYLKKPHYRLTIERVVPDFCKGLFIEGTVIELDLAKDAGLKGEYTVSITNMVYSAAGE